MDVQFPVHNPNRRFPQPPNLRLSPGRVHHLPHVEAVDELRDDRGGAAGHAGETISRLCD